MCVQNPAVSETTSSPGLGALSSMSTPVSGRANCQHASPESFSQRRRSDSVCEKEMNFGGGFDDMDHADISCKSIDSSAIVDNHSLLASWDRESQRTVHTDIKQETKPNIPSELRRITKKGIVTLTEHPENVISSTAHSVTSVRSLPELSKHFEVLQKNDDDGQVLETSLVISKSVEREQYSDTNNIEQISSCIHNGRGRKRKSLTCDYCPKSFQERKCVLVHMRKCHSDVHGMSSSKKGKGRKRKPLTCDYCPETYPSRRLVLCHMRRCHSGMPGIIKTYVCSICGKTNGSNGELKLHMKRHTKVRSFACTQCPRTFLMKGELNAHERLVHTDIKPFLCTMCGSSFNKRSSLKRHLLLHTGVKDFKCDICGKTFRARNQLGRHVESIHSTFRPFKCPLCPAEYANRAPLKVHLRKSKVHAGERLDVDELLVKCGYPATDTTLK